MEGEGKKGEGEHEGMGWAKGGRTVRERKERDILIEGAIKGLSKNIALEKIPGILKGDLSYDSKQQWRGHLNWLCLVIRLMTP